MIQSALFKSQIAKKHPVYHKNVEEEEKTPDPSYKK